MQKALLINQTLVDSALGLRVSTLKFTSLNFAIFHGCSFFCQSNCLSRFAVAYFTRLWFLV